MDNHVHFIVVPSDTDSLAKTFNQAHMRYSQYHNEKTGKRGHLWQGRFYPCPLHEVHLYTAIRYVERNPVRAGLVNQGEDYPWSSALSHVKGIRDCTNTGYPAENESFVMRLEGLVLGGKEGCLVPAGGG